MKNTQTVRKAMGLVQFQFVDISNGSYKYTNSDKYFKMQAKWKKHIPSLRGRSQAIILTAEKPSNSKSGSSYDIMGVFAILESHQELKDLNEMYWDAIKYKTTDVEKLKATKQFADDTIAILLEAERTTAHLESTYQLLNALVLSVEANDTPVPTKTTKTTKINGLTF